ncbi:cytochrome c [Hydrogenimonas thermophila]|uniref:Cytochrome C n=1 Tax=Hydrogenimonas thermophila TaxID=223786 RepID=A0A1I5SGZ0_9BACT|nr:cytochrome c [Hydrogenimonas thermophila]SFP69969.1 Cytochrome C' [Hydrogenimonas thermophila]
MKNIISKFIVFLIIVFSVNSYANEQDGVKALSPEIRGLLSQEMKAIQKGMISIIPELASGNYEAVSKIAKQIKESFILKQKLTKEQKKELKHKLPTAFIEMDREFHKDAGMLMHVAKMKNGELANYYYFKMSNACIKCHSKFAKHRFPAFSSTKEDSGHHH